MKFFLKKSLVYPVLPLFASVSLIYSAAYANDKEIDIRADEWCPYNCDPSSDKPGYMIEIAKSVLESKGYSIKYQIMNWARSIKFSEEGKIDGIIGATKADSPDSVFPSVELGRYNDSFFTLKDSAWKYQNIESLTKASSKIGVIKDYGYQPELKKFIEDNPKYFHFATGEQPLSLLINMLMTKRIEALTENPQVFYYTLESMKISKDKIAFAGKHEVSSDLYIAFSSHPSKIKKSQEIAKLLSEGIEELRKSGKLKEILNRYGLEDWRN